MAWRIILPDGTFEDESIDKWRTAVDKCMTLVINSDEVENTSLIAYWDKRVTELEAEILAKGLTIPRYPK
jgi:hypothetical protein